MSDHGSDSHSDHKQVNEFDGIVENNYPMPAWWVWSFIFTVIFGFLYFIHMFSGAGEDSFREHARLEKEHFHRYPKPASVDLNESELKAILDSPDSLAKGKDAYHRVCQSCHQDQMQGLVGPNLTDRFWIHGKGTAKDIYKVISEGVLDKGMPAWGSILSKEEIGGLVGFILSLKNTNPSGAKAPQGDEVSDY